MTPCCRIANEKKKIPDVVAVGKGIFGGIVNEISFNFVEFFVISEPDIEMSGSEVR